MRPDNNPKSLQGQKKPNMFLTPAVAKIHMAMAFEDGANKYGAYNWRENSVAASVYIAAAERHLEAYKEGKREDGVQTCDLKSGVHHLGHLMACCAILLDAEACGNLIDDRPIAVDINKIMDYYIELKTEKQDVG